MTIPFHSTIRNACNSLGAFDFEKKEIIELKEKLARTSSDFSRLVMQAQSWEGKFAELENAHAELQREHTRLMDIAGKDIAKDPLETLWTNAHPRIRKEYSCRPLYSVVSGELKKQIVSVDVLDFWQHKGKSVQDTASMIKALNTQAVKESDYDTLAWLCERWVKQNIKYRGDKDTTKVAEYWQFPHETYKLRSGDCEDGAIYSANLMLAVGIPYWRVRLNVGAVKGGRHAYVSYCRQSDNQFTTSDWCYWTTDKKMPERKMHKDQRDYYGIEFSWDLSSAYQKTEYSEKEVLDENP